MINIPIYLYYIYGGGNLFSFSFICYLNLTYNTYYKYQKYANIYLQKREYKSCYMYKTLDLNIQILDNFKYCSDNVCALLNMCKRYF